MSLVACTALAWWRGWWRLRGRFTYTLVAVAAVVFSMIAITYNLIV